METESEAKTIPSHSQNNDQLPAHNPAIIQSPSSNLRRENDKQISQIPLREYSEYLATLPPFAKGTTVVKWLNRCLKMIPHGRGNTPHDRALLNKMITLLRKSKTDKGSEVAEALTTLQQTEKLRWNHLLTIISQSFPSGMVELSDKINECIRDFQWNKHNATLHFTPPFMEAGIPLKTKRIMDMDHGLDYLSRIRGRIPEAIQINLLGIEQQTWEQFFSKLQEYQNMLNGDK